MQFLTVRFGERLRIGDVIAVVARAPGRADRVRVRFPDAPRRVRIMRGEFKPLQPRPVGVFTDALEGKVACERCHGKCVIDGVECPSCLGYGYFER
jgi:sRNA-binding carbon storage regulator CsrA